MIKWLHADVLALVNIHQVLSSPYMKSGAPAQHHQQVQNAL